MVFHILIILVKHGGGSIMMWTRFAASEPALNSELHKQILQGFVKVSICELKFNTEWIMQTQSGSCKHRVDYANLGLL